MSIVEQPSTSDGDDDDGTTVSTMADLIDTPAPRPHGRQGSRLQAVLEAESRAEIWTSPRRTLEPGDHWISTFSWPSSPGRRWARRSRRTTRKLASPCA